MRQRGTLRGWKDDKGFGFVTPLAGGEEAFVHINAFLNRQRRPVDGDEISYEAVQDFQKRWQAKSIRFADEPMPAAAAVVAEKPAPISRSSSPRSALPVLRILLALLVLAILGLVGYQAWLRPDAFARWAPSPSRPQAAPAARLPSAAAVASPPASQSPAAEGPRHELSGGRPSVLPFTGAEPAAMETEVRAGDSGSSFQCDGRTRCSQMHSCAEANWFLAHCPDTKMDGDDDGIACESQWCSGG